MEKSIHHTKTKDIYYFIYFYIASALAQYMYMYIILFLKLSNVALFSNGKTSLVIFGVYRHMHGPLKTILVSYVVD